MKLPMRLVFVCVFVLLGNYLVKNSRHAWSLFGAVSDERNI